MLNVTLSPSQEAAVQAPWEREVCMILSTAGSGKTLVLTKRVIRIAKELVQKNIRHKPLLCICFNTSAADEMHERISQLLYTEGLSEKVHATRSTQSRNCVLTIEVRTFHGLGLWIIRNASILQRSVIGLSPGPIKVLHGKDLDELTAASLYEAGYLTTSKKSNKAEVTKFGKSFRKHKLETCDVACEMILQEGTAKIEQSVVNNDEGRNVKEEVTPAGANLPTQFKVKHYMHQAPFEIYEQRMAEENAIDFDDMIVKSNKLLEESAESRERAASRYSSVLVDEFQDMSSSNLLLCKMLVGKTKSLTLVGDDDQQIYSFRMTDGWFCHEVVQRVFVNNVTCFTLPENRRCPGAIVKTAGAVIQRNSRRITKDISAVRDDGLPVSIVGCQNVALEMNFVTQKIQSLLPSVESTGGQILVLFRTNDLLNKFNKLLTSAGVRTTRVFTPQRSKKVEAIGSKTLAVFCALSLMSPNLEKDAFVWAAATVSPTLEPQVLDGILDGSESAVGGDRVLKPIVTKQETLLTGVARSVLPKREDVQRLSPDVPLSAISPIAASARMPGEAKAVEVPKGQSKISLSSQAKSEQSIEGYEGYVLGRAYSSPILDKVRKWFDLRKRTEEGFRTSASFEPIHILLSVVDKLSLMMRTSTRLEDVVRSAEEVLSQQNIGDYEMTPAQDLELESPFRTDSTLAGYDLVLAAARKIDSSDSSGEYRGRGPVNVKLNLAENADVAVSSQEDEDFAALFAQDDEARSRKRRKGQGIRTIAWREKKTQVRSGAVASRIQELVKVLTNKLKQLDVRVANQATLSEQERPSIVLSTVHKAKGTTFPHVFLCGTDHDNFPNGARRFSSDGRTIDLQSTHCQEERRMFFVAMTRAQKTFTCSYSIAHFEGFCGNHPKSYQCPFIQELIDGVQGDANCVIESFVQKPEDIAVLVS